MLAVPVYTCAREYKTLPMPHQRHVAGHPSMVAISGHCIVVPMDVKGGPEYNKLVCGPLSLSTFEVPLKV